MFTFVDSKLEDKRLLHEYKFCTETEGFSCRCSYSKMKVPGKKIEIVFLSVENVINKTTWKIILRKYVFITH
jgi:hypothetical protein